MVKRIAAIVGLLFVGAIVFVVAYTVAFAEGSVGCTLPSGRSISASSNHFMLSMESGMNNATIETGGHKILIQPDALLIDGARVAGIPLATKAVDVRVHSGEVEFIADGVMVGPPISFVK